MPLATRTQAATLAATLLAIGALAVQLGAACNVPAARVQQAQEDLCKARAAYKLVALAAGGALDPKPGTPRETLERAEDEFCAARAALAAPAVDDGGA